MTTIRTLWGGLAVFALAAAGCVGQARSDLVISSDAALSAMAAELLPDLASRAGMTLVAPIRVEKRSRAQLVRYLEAKLDEELPPDEARARVDVYSLLGMVPADLDLRAVLLELYTEQVAGFYEPDSTALFVLDDQPAEAIEALLVHELVHAIQDQTIDLDAITDAARVGGDAATAAQAAIEGHATLVMFEHLTVQMTGQPIDLGSIPDFGAQVRPALEAMNAQFPALASAPEVIRASLFFPYVDGAEFVQRLWTGGERLTPFGERLPRSTEQVVDPAAAPPVEVELSVTGGRVVHEDVLGRLELGVFLEGLLGDRREAAAVIRGWDGDRYTLVERQDGTRALASVIVWDSVAHRDRFLDVVRSASGSLGGEATIEAIDLSGTPASVLRVGGGGYSLAASLGASGAR